SALDRLGYFSVFNQISFAGGKNKFAVGDIDLTAPERNRVKSFFHRAKNIVRLALPRQHEGVCHPRHWNVGVTLTPPVSSERHLHERRIETVLQITLENTIFYENRSACRCAFVVDIDGSAARRNCSIVNYRT